MYELKMHSISTRRKKHFSLNVGQELSACFESAFFQKMQNFYLARNAFSLIAKLAVSREIARTLRRGHELYQ